MRLLALGTSLLLFVPLATADDGVQEGAEGDCAALSIDSIPPNEVALSVPCAAQQVADSMPVGGDLLLCAFNATWGVAAPQHQQGGTPLSVLRIQGASGCVPN